MKKLFTLLTLLVLLGGGKSWGQDVATFNFGGASDAVAGDLTAWTTSLSTASEANVILGSETESGKTIKKGGSTYSGAIFELKNQESGGTSTLTTKSSYASISKITFNITSSDAGKAYLTVQVSPDKDFSVSENIVTLIDNKNLKNDLSVSSNGTFAQQTCNLGTAKTGYIRFSFTNNSGSAGKYYELDDVEITYVADPRSNLSLSFTPDNQTIGVGGTLTTSFSNLTDISSESAKYSAVAYSSDDEGIATVSSTGVITGVAAGTTKINAIITADGDATYKTTKASITVNIVDPVTLGSSVENPTATLDFSNASSASTLLNGAWNANYGRPLFGNDGDNNYMVCSVVTLYSATQDWITKDDTGSSTPDAWDAIGIFKGASAYGHERAATTSIKTSSKNSYYAFRIKGVSKIEMLADTRGASITITLAAYEITEGTPATTTSLYNQSKGNSGTKRTLSINLESSKEYLIVVNNDSESNSRLYEMAFFYDSSIDFENITVGEYEWATYVNSSKALDFTGSDVKAYIVTGHSGSAITKSDALTTVAANTPLLLNASEGTYVIPVAASGTDYSATNLLKAGNGSDISPLASQTAYVLSAEDGAAKFVKVGSIKPAVPTGKAYLLFNEEIAAREFLDIDIDGVSTGIKNMKVGSEDNVYYDLQGRRVLYPTKGLYIVNGKKVVIK